MRKLLLALAALVGFSLVACQGLTEEDYARLNDLYHESQTRQLTPAELAEIRSIWDKRGDFDWQAIIAALVGAAGGFVSTNTYRNKKRKKLGPDYS